MAIKKEHSKVSREELMQQINHGEEMEKMVKTPAYQEIYGRYTKMLGDYYKLKQDSDIEGIMKDPIRLQYVVDTERRAKYQLELFQYIDDVIAKGKKAKGLLQAMPV